MKSILKLYEVEFKPELNPLVENLADYLAQCERSTYNDFQYIRHNLSIVIKVPMDQMYVDNFPFNYASIQNEDESIFYYYIMNTSWVAERTVALTLGMDTVNTLGQPGSLGHPSMFTDETHIYRQHGDRFYDTGQRDQAGGKLLRRRIDREDEGFDVPFEKTSSEVARDSIFGLDKWALMYKIGIEGAVDVNTPLDVFIVPEEPYTVRVPGGTGAVIWDYQSFTPGTYYYFTGIDNPGGQLVGTLASGDSKSFSVSDNSYILIYPKYTYAGDLRFAIREFINNGTKAISSWKFYDNYTKIEFLAGSRVRYGTAGPTAELGDTEYLSAANVVSQFPAYVSIAPNVATSTLKTLKDVDRYDPQITKIIRVPYCPLSLSKSSDGIYAVPVGWTVSEGYLKWTGVGLPDLERTDVVKFTRNLIDYWYPAPKQAKEVARESKLYHSDFFTWAAVYDSFAKQIFLERFDLSETDPGRITVDFKQTNTLGNNAVFKFNFDDFAPYHTVENYEEYLLVDRNNEEPIFTSDYVNYLRSGYQYDVAANKIAESRARAEMIATTAGAVSNLAVSGINSWGKKEVWTLNGREISAAQAERIGEAYDTGRISLPNLDTYEKKGFYKNGTNVAPLVWQTAFNSTASAASSIISYATLLKTNKMAMNNKLANLQRQAVGVSGSGTIDLLEYYNGNALNILTYEPRLTVKRRIYDFFDYFGYSHDYYEVPNVNSRYWYNYIQCSPMLVEEGLGKYKETWLEDLKARYEIGVVVFHDRNDEWNFKRRWENWETWVITE